MAKAVTVEVTKEQVQELHAHLVEQGIDVVGADGRAATSEAARVEAAAVAAEAAQFNARTELEAARTALGRPHAAIGAHLGLAALGFPPLRVQIRSA